MSKTPYSIRNPISSDDHFPRWFPALRSRRAREFSRLIVRFGKALPTAMLDHIKKSNRKTEQIESEPM